MTIPSTTNRNDYTGNGATDTYAYSFKIFSDTSLLVTQRDTSNEESTLTLGVDYTVTGVGETSGGDVVLSAGNLTTNYLLTIRRVRPLTQNSDLRNQGEFFPETYEDALDILTMNDQQQQDEIDRSFILPETVIGVSTELPVPVAGQLFRWDSSGTSLEGITAGDLSVVTTFGAEFIFSANDLSLVNPNRLVTGGGTADVITGTASPTPASLTNSLMVIVEASGANTVTTPTFNLNSLGAKTIVKGSDTALAVGDIVGANFRMLLSFDVSLDKWVLLNPTDYLSKTDGGTVVGATTFSGAVTASSTLGVTGVTNLTSAELSTTLSVTGESTLSGGFQTDGTTLIRIKVVDIGDWDMVADSTKVVAHGLGTNGSKKILSVAGIVRRDGDDDVFKPIPYPSVTGTDWELGFNTVDADNIDLWRLTGGHFDSTAYNDTSYNRGRLIITYTNTDIS